MTKKNKFFAVSASAALVASVIVPVAASASEQFEDAGKINKWAEEAVSYFVEQNVITGKPGNLFDPQGKVTRAEAAKMFATGLNLEADVEEVTFTDAKAHWAAKEIAQVAAADIVGGYEDGTFKPNGSLTRAEAATMVVNALSLEGTADLATYTDVKAGAWYEEAIQIAVANKVLNGKSASTMDPNGNVTREEFSAMLYRAFEAADLIEVNLETALEVMEAAEAKVASVEEVNKENVEALKADVVALEEAIVAVEAFESDEEEVATAVEAAKATAEAAKTEIAKFEALIQVAVSEIKAVSETTVEVTFAEGVEITAEDLEGAELVLTAGETEVTATYLAESFSNNTAVFVLAADAKLVDETTYTATADWMTEEASFIVAFSNPYAKTLTIETTGMAAGTSNVVTVTAVDQYGEEFDVTTKAFEASVKINGVPQAGTIQVVDGKFELTNEVAEGNTVEITVTNIETKNNEEVKYTTSKTFTVAKAAAPVATTIGNLEAKITRATKEVETVAVGDVIDLTVDVKDQYNNPAVSPVLTWTVNGEVVTGQTSAAFTHTVTEAGELTIEAYIANGEKVTYKTTVAAQPLASIDIDSTGTVVNNEVSKFVVAQTPAKTVAPADFTYEVLSAPKGVDAKAVEVTFAYGEGADKDKIYASIKTPVNGEGEYKIKVMAADKSDEITVTSAPNTTVTDIKVDSIETNELQVGKEVVKAITFFNKHGEEVKVTDAATITAVTTAGIAQSDVKFYGANEKGEQVTSITDGIKFVGIKATTEGAKTVTLVKDEASVLVKGTAVEAGKIAKVTLGSAAASTIVNDAYDAEAAAKVTEAADNVALVGGKAYTLIPVTAVDSYGKDYELTVADFDPLTVDNADVKLFSSLENDAVATDVVKYIGVHATSDSAKSAVLEVKVKDAVEGFVAPKKTITIKKARELATITATPSTGSVVLGKAATYEIAGLDQYGIATDLTTADFHVAAANNAEFTAGAFAVENGKLTVDVTGDKVGTHTVTIYKGESLEKAVAKTNVTLKVQELGDAIANVEISKEVKNGATELSTDNVLKVDGATTFALETIAKDAEGHVVSFDKAGLHYTVASNEIKDAEGNKLAAVAVNNNGEVTVTPEAGKEFESTIDVTVTTLTGKTATITLEVSNKAAVAQEGTLYFTTTATGLDAEGLALDAIEGTIAITPADAEKAQKTRTIYLVGVDQYANVIAVDTSAVASMNSNITAAKDAANGIVLTAANAGTSTVNVFVNGKLAKAITVSATEQDVEAN